MNENKFEDLPAHFQVTACRVLAHMLMQIPTGSIISLSVFNATSHTEIVLSVRKYFIDLYFGDDADIEESAKKETLGSDGVTYLNKAEIKSGVSRVKWAEGLIRQLPESHDGRNSWLLNYGSQNNETSTERAIIEASKKAESAMRSGS